MCELKNKFTYLFKGFTLLEVILSISVFGIISVTLTNIVLSITYISSNLDRRNDVLHVINTIDAILGNEIRAADKVVFCNQSNQNGFYLVRNLQNTVIYKLIKSQNDSLVLQELNNEPTNCIFVPQLPTLTLNPNDIKIINFSIKYSSDSSNNLLIYVSFQVCDGDDIPKQKIVFNCNNNPYKHVFAVSNKKL